VLLTDLSAHPVIAHRGNSAHAPENTFPAYDEALTLGADALEFDVRLTRDGVPVVIHDPSVDRTTNGHGFVTSFDLAELRRLDAGARFSVDGGRTFPFRGQGLVVPALEEMLTRYRHTPLLIEVKIPHAVEATRRLLERFGAMERTLVDSTDHAAVAPFRGGSLATGASLADVLRLIPSALMGCAPRSLPYVALCIPRRYNGIPVPVSRLARAARAVGSVTHVWTVNDPKAARRLWRQGIQGIITDDPGPMLQARVEGGL
jgi:glycerophosphoryl diester phosphodiesterase